MNLPSTNSLTAENLYIQIHDLILSSRKSAARDINVLQVYTNFEIGKHIVEYEQQGKTRAVYGKEIIDSLSKRLSADFGSGFSRSNISSMRKFYLAYQDKNRIIQTLSGQSGNSGDNSTAASTSSGISGDGRKSKVLGVQPGERHHRPDRALSPRTRQRLSLRVTTEALHFRCRAFLRRSRVLQSPSAELRSDRPQAWETDPPGPRPNESLVEITLPKGANIHAGEYQLYLPSKEELQSKLAEWVREAEVNYPEILDS